MATLVGYPGGYANGDTSVVDAALTLPIFTRGFDTNGNEYIYLHGATTIITSAGWWVTYDESGIPTLLAANAVGPVAIAMALVDTATKAGWFQIWGNNTIAKSDTTAADKALFIDGTAGRVDDAVVSGDLVVGAVSTAADTTNVLPVWLSYPHVNDVLG